jgi:hypothetical protein
MESALPSIQFNDRTSGADLVVHLRPQSLAGSAAPEPRLEEAETPEKSVFRIDEEEQSIKKQKLLDSSMAAKAVSEQEKHQPGEISLYLHANLLRKESPYFEARLTRWEKDSSAQSTSDPGLMELVVGECVDVSTCSLALQILYTQSLKKEPLPFTSTKHALAVLKAASFLACERSIKACCDYLNAAVWPEEEVDTIKEDVALLGSDVVAFLQDKLTRFKRDAEFSVSLLESLLLGMISGNTVARKLLENHAQQQWQGCPRKLVDQIFESRMVQLGLKLTTLAQVCMERQEHKH